MSFQTPGGHDAKRRRIEAANATLRKPFRSPLVNRQQHETPGPNGPQQNSPNINRISTATDSVTPHTPVPTRGSRHAPTAASPLSTSPTLAPWSPQPKEQAATTTAAGSLTARPTRRPLPIKNQTTPRHQPQPHSQPHPQPNSQSGTNRGAPTPTTTSTKPAQAAKEEREETDDDEEDEEDEEDLLTRFTTAQRTLQSHLRVAQSRLALVRQAAQIERRASSALTERPGQPVGVDLTGLIGKWKGASRLAAEEVFGLVKGRVEGMGGVKAWRESQRRQREFYAGGFDVTAVVRKGGSVGDGQDEDGEWGGEGEVGREVGEGEEEEEEEEGEESEEFTMLMMLQSLNIDPDVLGYDPVEDRWRD